MMPPNGTFVGEVLLGEGADISPEVRIVGSAAVGNRSRISQSCVMGPGAIIGDNCLVANGAHVIHSIVLDGSMLEPGERLLGVIRLPSGKVF